MAFLAVRSHATFWERCLCCPCVPRGVAGASQIHGAGGLTAQFAMAVHRSSHTEIGFRACREKKKKRRKKRNDRHGLPMALSPARCSRARAQLSHATFAI